MDCPVPECKQRAPTALGQKLKRARPWVQTGFLGLWLAPVGQWLHGIPGCVFHCYSCPLSAFACPVGVAANYAALEGRRGRTSAAEIQAAAQETGA